MLVTEGTKLPKGKKLPRVSASAYKRSDLIKGRKAPTIAEAMAASSTFKVTLAANVVASVAAMRAFEGDVVDLWVTAELRAARSASRFGWSGSSLVDPTDADGRRRITVGEWTKVMTRRAKAWLAMAEGLSNSDLLALVAEEDREACKGLAVDKRDAMNAVLNPVPLAAAA